MKYAYTIPNIRYSRVKKWADVLNLTYLPSEKSVDILRLPSKTSVDILGILYSNDTHWYVNISASNSAATDE